MNRQPSWPATCAAAAATLIALGCAFDAADAAETPEPAAAQPQARFPVMEYRVLDNTVLPAVEIEQLLYPLLGPDRTIDDVEQARAALEAHYHDRGYATVFVDIPEQDVDEGIVRLHVTEGTLTRTRVTGANYFSGRAIRKAVPEARDNTVPHVPTLQAQLAQLNGETPDRVVTPVLKAGAAPGTVELALNVRDELPVHASVALNNQYTTDTSPLRAVASLSYDNLFGRLDSLSLQYQTAPEEPGEVDVWAASYTARLTDVGTKLAFFFVDSNSNVAAVGDGGSAVNVIGKGQIYGMRLVHPLMASPQASHAFIGGVEYKDFTDSVFSEDLVLTPIAYVNFSAGHASVWRRPSTQWSLSTSANFGVRDVVNDSEEFRIKRRKGVPNYFLLRGDGSVATALPWHLNLRLRVAGQLAMDSIISNEQFAIAGADGVRGYLEAEVLGDLGFKTSLEIGSPRWNLFGDRLQTEVFAFFDYGRASRINPLREQDPNTLEYGELLEPPTLSLRSAGAGLNFSISRYFDAALAWAYPFVDSGTQTGTHAGDSRVLFNVRASW